MRTAEVDAGTTTDLRRAVLRPAWAPGTPMSGDDDPSAVHVAAFEGDEIVGTCVLFPRQSPHRPGTGETWQLRGMATAEEHRGRGIGAAVLAQAVESARARGATLLWCKARVTAEAFYAAHGFVVDSDEYVETETGLAHRDMSRLLGTG